MLHIARSRRTLRSPRHGAPQTMDPRRRTPSPSARETRRARDTHRPRKLRSEEAPEEGAETVSVSPAGKADTSPTGDSRRDPNIFPKVGNPWPK